MAMNPGSFDNGDRRWRGALVGCARLTFGSLLLMAIALAHSGAHALDPDDPPVWIYAKKCFDRVGLSNHRDLRGPFNCEDGERLPVTVNGHVGDIGLCSGGHCRTGFPDGVIGLTQAGRPISGPGCDSPAWLAGEHQCYGNSYLSLWIPESNKNIRAALLCRHNKRWTDNVRKFDDVAMIVHNVKNGETCWFQSQLGRTLGLDGKKVWGPAAVRSHLFWQRPKEAMEIGCIACHDSGPFVVSPWIRNAFDSAKFFDSRRGPYRNSEPPFDRWSHPRYVDIGKFGLTGSAKPCTACHKIAAGGELDSNGDGRVDGDDRTWQTCETWIGWATTKQGKVEGINDTHKTQPVYMPPARISDPDGFLMPGGEWESRYGAHVKQLLSCCRRLGRDNKDTDRDCKFFKPKG
jgi:hypothetical protein